MIFLSMITSRRLFDAIYQGAVPLFPFFEKCPLDDQKEDKDHDDPGRDLGYEFRDRIPENEAKNHR